MQIFLKSILIQLVAVILLLQFSSPIEAQNYRPPKLEKGDTIALISPSRPASKEKVETLDKVLADMGYTLILAPNAMQSCEGYAGTPSQRFKDIKWALANPAVKAIIASRGGYGATQLLDSLSTLEINHPKWMIGFSDFTVIHAWLNSKGIQSIHGPMANTFREKSVPVRNLIDILEGKHEPIYLACDSLNRPGNATGILRGGNLSVLADLIATPYDIIQPGTILFIEDVEEPIYKIERILWQLRISGAFDKIAGLIVGQFTDYKPEQQFSTTEDMIKSMVSDYKFPVAFKAPVGHVSWNMPIIEGAKVRFEVDSLLRGKIVYMQ